MNHPITESYQIQKTKDGSLTLLHKGYQETLHSLEGAHKETDLYYIQGCQIPRRGMEFQHGTAPLPILEMGFGIGIGHERTVTELMKLDSPPPLLYVALEWDEAPILWGQKEVPPAFPHGPYPLRSNLVRDSFHGIPCLREVARSGELVILLGDARENVRKLRDSMMGVFRAIYQDAYSPRKNSALWTVEWFKDLKDWAHEDCILSTYSASSAARKAMLLAGWVIQEGVPLMEGKRPSTVATLKGKSSPSLLAKLEKSPVAPLTDSNYGTYPWGHCNALINSRTY